MPPLLPASPLTSTAAVVRELLLAAGGAPQRMSQLFAAANAAVGPLSRTHFREAIVAGMFARGELRKQRVVPAAAAAAGAGAGASGGASSAGGAAAASSSSSSSSAAELRPFFGITLAPSAKARALVREARAPGGKLAATLAAVAAARARAVPAPAAAAVAAVAVKAAAAAPAAAAAAPPPLR
jgi:hypothetical protein